MSIKDNKLHVLKLFFDGPNTRLHIREVARRTGLSAYGALKILESLREEGLLIREDTGVVVNYAPCSDSELFVGLKRSQNLLSMYSTGLLTRLIEFFGNPECIVLFGSYARGEDNRDSDIDLAVVTGQREVSDLSAYEEVLKRKINVHLIETMIGETVSFRNGLANGIVLAGYLELV